MRSNNGLTNLGDAMTVRPDSGKSDRSKHKEHRPIIGPGELVETVNKRSESANRKFRAYRNFIKYHKNNNK